MTKKISIIGSGCVGSMVAFNILAHFNLKELVLVDIAGNLARGTALDLEDTRKFLGFSTHIEGTSDFSRIKNSDIVVITAGITRKEGMNRLDLLKINTKIAQEVSSKIKKFSPSSIIIVITNPLDLITYTVIKKTRFPRNRILGMGSSLDSARLLNLLHQMTNISTLNMGGLVFGPHNKNMIVHLDQITIKGENITSFLGKEKTKRIQQRVKLRGAEIVGFLKTKSAYFAPALACYHLIDAIVNNRNVIIPVSVLLKGEYGLRDICMGVPCLINKNGAEKIIEIKLTQKEKRLFRQLITNNR